MMYRRRLVALALAGLLALTGLAACQLSPGVAAQVGDTRITDERVDRIVAELRASLSPGLESQLEAIEQGGGGASQRDLLTEQFTAQIADLRSQVMTMLVLTEAGSRYAASEGLSVAPTPTSSAAEVLQLSEDHPYVEVYADFVSVLNALGQAAEPGEPSEADQREVYEHLEFQGQPVDVPFEEVQPLLTVDLLGGPVGVRDLLATVIERAEVRVQPGYELVHRVPVQIGNANSWLGVQISEPAQVLDAD